MNLIVSFRSGDLLSFLFRFIFPFFFFLRSLVNQEVQSREGKSVLLFPFWPQQHQQQHPDDGLLGDPLPVWSLIDAWTTIILGWSSNRNSIIERPGCACGFVVTCFPLYSSSSSSGFAAIIRGAPGMRVTMPQRLCVEFHTAFWCFRTKWKGNRGQSILE